jgi:alanine racemase
VLAIVKADAYGHGVVPVATRLEDEGVDGFGVALAEEGLELREAGISTEILVLNGVYGGAHRDVLEAGLTPVLYDLGDAARFAEASGGRPFGVHLKIDTGMGRLGVTMRAVDAFLDALARHPAVRVDGVMTHLAAADSDASFTAAQLGRFELALAKIRARGHAPRTIHAANTSATFLHEAARYDLVRTGIALFGHALGADENALGLRPAMRLRTEVIALRDLEAGESIGYDHTFTAKGPMRVATVPMGYGDGLVRALGNAGAMLVHGVRCPIVGRVSMDLTTIDVTAIEAASVGDEAVVLGSQGEARIDATEIAAQVGTIPYEIMTNVSRRVPRVYV